MKTINGNKKLTFGKKAITELNQDALNEIKGGTSIVNVTPYIATITDLPNLSKNTLCTSDAK